MFAARNPTGGQEDWNRAGLETHLSTNLWAGVMHLESFPRRDLPPELSRTLLEVLTAGHEPTLPDWIRGLSAPDAALPAEGSLTPAERTLALATIWSEAKFNFAYWDRLPGEAWWDRQFVAYLPRVAAAGTEDEYWTLLEEFAACLDDGHTGVYRPPHLRPGEARPPLQLRDVAGRPVVVEGGLLPSGSEILRVDGRLVADIRADWARRQIASPPLTAATLTARRVLAGPAGSTAVVEVRLPSGETREVRLERTGPLPERPPLEVQEAAPGIFHVGVHTMDTGETSEQFHRYFPDFAGVRGLVLDVRWNNGGSSGVGYSILARLLHDPCLTSAFRLRLYVPAIRAWWADQAWLSLPADPLEPDAARPRFTGPVAVLSSPLTVSAAEDFLVAFKASRRGPIVGEPSYGSTGQPLFAPLPGGGAVRICSKRDTHPDGTDFMGTGITPDIACAPTIAGLAAGRDEVLERAMAYIEAALGVR